MGLRQKLVVIWSILFFAIKTYPIRIYRVVKHLLPIRYKLGGEITFPKLILEWVVSLFLYFTDLLLFPEIICITVVLLKKNVRGLTPKEKEIRELLFGDKLKVPTLINDDASWLTRNGKFAFVSFYIINSDGLMKDRTFAHELIHIYQFSRYGSPYIIRSLLAQRTPSAYTYGGASRLLEMYSNQQSQGHLNYEQQGEVLADYYQLLISKGQLSQSKFDYLLLIYNYIINQWKKKEVYRW